MHGRMHICAAATGRGGAPSGAVQRSAAASPRSPVNSAGIQRGSGSGSSGSHTLRCPPLWRGAASTAQGGEDLRPFEVTETKTREAEPVQGKHKLCHFI